jgi:hypothetical protein
LFDSSLSDLLRIDEETLLSFRNEATVACLPLDISPIFNGYETSESKISPEIAPPAQSNNITSSVPSSQSTTLPPQPQTVRRRRSLNEYYQNDTPRRTISESSTHSKETYNERWDWEEVGQILKPVDKGEEFVSISRYADSFFNPTELIDVSAAAGVTNLTAVDEPL